MFCETGRDAYPTDGLRLMSRVKIAVGKALGDKPLGTAVLKSCLLSSDKRNSTIAELEDYEALRKQARAIRERSLDRLDELLNRFKQSFISAGGTVHIAADANQACVIVLDILKKRNAKQGVKSKSMVSEEIGLGGSLKHHGIDAVESDLGEFIVQLAGEPPSHITAPALHRSKESIGRLLADKLKFPYTSDPATLTKVARGHLRERFLKAEFGIAGANFLVADSGHIVLVENEGNGRMGFSLPPLFISITGIEKLIGNLPELSPLLRLLARSATGQRFSTYTSLIRPTQPGEDGPKEMHVVLVDNGRRQALADPQMKEMLLCIRCGACLNICPVYRSVGGHAYISVYPGPMGAVWSNLVGRPSVEKSELADLSTLCGACKEVCPVNIDIPRMLLELRDRREKPRIEQMAASAWSWVMEDPKRYERMGKLARTTGVLLPNGFAGGWLATGHAAFRDSIRKTDEGADE